MADEFLRKVYDKYLGSDYEFGDSDLNPKREISKSSLEQLEENEQAILEKITERLRQLAAQAATLPKYKVPEKVDNDNYVTESSGAGMSADPSPEDNENETAIKIALGGDPNDSHIFFPGGGIDTQVDFLMGELEKIMIPVLAMVDPPTTPGPGPTAGDQAQLFNPGCDDDSDDSSIYESSNSDYKNFKAAIEAENATAESDSDDSEDEDDNEKSSSSKSSAEAADDTAQETVQTRDANVAAQQKKVAECIAAELPLLSSILAILKVVNTVKKVLLLVLTIVVPIVKMIAFAAQCWINPPAAAQVIQMVAEKIAALLISAIGEILQMLWNMLEMDCKTEQVQKVLDQINEILTGVSSAIVSSKTATISFTNQMKSVGKSLEDSFEKFQQTEQWQKWADETAEALTDTDTMNNLLFNGEGLTAAGMKQLMQQALPSDIKSKLNKLSNSAQAVAKNTKKAIAEADLSKDAKTAGVQQTLDDLAGLFGTFRIK